MQVLQLIGLILLWLLALAILRGFCRFVAGLFAARKAVEPHRALAEPSAIVTLIHGTFARNAAWAQPGSRLCQAVERHFAGQVQLRRFNWSGRNSFRARESGIAELTQDLATARAQWPGVPHYLVGHSHGGSVALGAALACEPGDVDGVVCLATPVLTTRRRRFSRGVRVMIGLGFFVTLVIPWMDMESEADLTDFESALMLACAIVAFVWYKAAKKLARKVCAARPYSGLDPARVAFIRSPFDEASGVIGVANLLSWTVSRLTAGPFELFASFERLEAGSSRLRMGLGYAALIAGGVALQTLPEWLPASRAPIVNSSPLGTVHVALYLLMLVVGIGGLAMTVLAPLLRLSRRHESLAWILWPVYLYVGLFGAIFFVPAIVLMSVVQAATVGIELLVCSVLVEVTAEPCPAGNWTLYQMRPPPEGTLRHSSVYESESALAALTLALGGIAGDEPVQLMSDQLGRTASA